MKAVVTGGCGFIGSHLVDLLLKEGLLVEVIDNCSTGRVENLSHHKDNPKLKIHEFDIAESIQKLEKVFSGSTYIYHLAALADIVPSIQNPDLYYSSNVFGTYNVVQAARSVVGLKKLMYAASSSCYGLAEIFPTPESSPIKPEYPYALTKYLGEMTVLHWSKVFKIPSVSLRLFNVYGPRSRTSGTYGAVFGVFLAQKINQKPYTVVGDGTQTRDFTYVTDVVSAFYQMSKSNQTNEFFNVGSGQTYSINSLIDLLKGDKVHIPKRPGEPDCTFADIAKIKKAINYTPKVDLKTGVEKLVENIDYWKKAPVWDPASIKEATKDWFNALNN